MDDEDDIQDVFDDIFGKPLTQREKVEIIVMIGSYDEQHEVKTGQFTKIRKVIEMKSKQTYKR